MVLTGSPGYRKVIDDVITRSDEGTSVAGLSDVPDDPRARVPAGSAQGDDPEREPRAMGEIGVVPAVPTRDPADDRPLGEIGLLAEGGEVPGEAAERSIGEVGTLPGVPAGSTD